MTWEMSPHILLKNGRNASTNRLIITTTVTTVKAPLIGAPLSHR